MQGKNNSKSKRLKGKSKRLILSPLAEDLLIGAPAIAEYLGWDTRRVCHAQKYLPIDRVGKLLKGRKSELDRALSSHTADEHAA